MRTFRAAAVVPLVIVLAAIPGAGAPPVHKVAPGRATTYFDGPLDKTGEVDLETALNERLRGKITPERNVNALLIQAIGPIPPGNPQITPRYLTWLGIPELIETRSHLISLGDVEATDGRLPKPEIEQLFKQMEQSAETPWKAADFPHIAAWLKANEKPLKIVAEAARRDQYFNPLTTPDGQGLDGSGLTGVSPPTVVGAREIIRRLSCRAMLRLGEGLPDEAWDDLITGHRLGRFMTHGADMIEFFTGNALERVSGESHRLFLEKSRLSSRQLRRHLDELQTLPPVGSVADLLDLGDRVRVLDVLRLIRHGKFDVIEGEGELRFQFPPLTAEQQRRLADLDWTEIHRETNRRHDQTVAALRIPDRAARQKALKTLKAEVESVKGPPSGYASLPNFLFDKVPGKTPAQALCDRSLHVFNTSLTSASLFQHSHDLVVQHALNRRIAYALVIYRREHQHFPDKLTDLVPDYLPGVPTDLFTGKSLIYRTTTDGFLLYSFGLNEKDDGGRNRDDTPPGDDVRFRIDKLLPGPVR